MKNFFVIGDQASESLSPLIFNHWFKKYNIQAKYSFLEVTKKNFNSEVIKKLNDKNTQGLNVTIPFKKDVVKYPSKLIKDAEKSKKAKAFLSSTDWKVLRHIRETQLGIQTTLSTKEYVALEKERHKQAKLVK